MKRREFITFVASGVACWPLAVYGQKSPPLIGSLGNQATPPPNDLQGNALFQGFRDNGLMIGRDFIFEPYFTAGDDNRFSVIVHELARKHVRIILANTPAGVRAAQALEPPVAVLMMNMNDPVGEGLIASLAHPGGHTTGTASLNADVTPKLLELLHEILPAATVLAAVFQPSNPTHAEMMDNLQAKARPLGITVLPFPLRAPDDLDEMFSKLLSRRPSALQVLGDPLLSDLGGRISELALANQLPTFTNSETAVEAGGLICYGASVRTVLRRMGYYVRKILDGTEPGDLPVEQPTGLDLIVNLKTAVALGIEIPPTLLARADRVIE
jgi:putative ABC transport system substrate-binding protein